MRSRSLLAGGLVCLLAAWSLQGCARQSSVDAETQEDAQEQTETALRNPGAKPNTSGVFTSFNIYTDGNAPDNHYAPSGWMGDYGDLKINERYMDNPHSGTTSIQIVYSGKASQGARWAGMYWQNPPNNWGTRPGGYDLTGATKLTFWARGEKGGERIEEIKIGGITGEFGDSDTAGIGPVVLAKEWKQYTIDLAGKDLKSICGGLAWSTNLDVDPEGATFYLDDIKYEA